MTNITREQARNITAEIDAAIDAILAKHDLTKDKVRTTYGDEYSFKVTATVHNTDANGINQDSVEMSALRINAKLHGITDIESDLAGETIHVGGKDLIPAGYKPRATKRPFLMKDVADGKLYNYPASIARYFPSYQAEADYMSTVR